MAKAHGVTKKNRTVDERNPTLANANTHPRKRLKSEEKSIPVPTPTPMPVSTHITQPPNHQHQHHHPHLEQVKKPVVIVELGPPAGVNNTGDCFCKPNQYCCWNRCMKLGTMVGIIGFFDTLYVMFYEPLSFLFYLTLSGICAFVLLMWESTGKLATARGFTNKYQWWEAFMVPNEDGIYILLASYVISTVAGCNLGLRFKTMKRCPGIWWLMCNIYSTGLQVVSMIYFPFKANILNAIPMAIRVYQYWVVLTWDRFLVDRNNQVYAQEIHPHLAKELAEDDAEVSKLPPHHHRRSSQ